MLIYCLLHWSGISNQIQIRFITQISLKLPHTTDRQGGCNLNECLAFIYSHQTILILNRLKGQLYTDSIYICSSDTLWIIILSFNHNRCNLKKTDVDKNACPFVYHDRDQYTNVIDIYNMKNINQIEYATRNLFSIIPVVFLAIHAILLWLSPFPQQTAHRSF